MSRQNELYKAVAEEVLPGRVLDVACGLAPVLGALDRDSRDYYGCDFSSVAIGRLLKERPELTTRLSVSDSSNLPYPDEFFNTVLICELLEHLDDASIGKTLKEVWRVLKMGGKIVITVPAGRLARHESHLKFYYSDDVKQILMGYTDSYRCRLVGSWFLLEGDKH